MVELYELKLMPIDADNYWPPDIDQHVAQLDFGTSMMMDGQSVFGSVIVDPTVSTDSLDMDTMLRRCQDNKNNDYKLTFEDSGQWTTSGIGGSFTTTTNTTTASPPMPETRKVMNLLRKGNSSILHDRDRDNHNISLRLLEELNNDASSDDDEHFIQQRKEKIAMSLRDKLFDEILNNNGSDKSCGDNNTGVNGFGEFTTWGRISRESVEAQLPFNSNNINSLPELNKSKNCDKNRRENTTYSNKAISSPKINRNLVNPRFSTITEKIDQSGKQQQPTNKTDSKRPGPGSLVTNFMEHYKSKEADENDDFSPMDYVYSEVYLGNGRYIDMNDNEIGFIPPSTAAIQGQMDLRRLHSYGNGTANNSSNKRNCKRSESEINGLKPSSRRTFADLSPSRTAPDLKFIALSHKVPSICNSSTSFTNLKKAKSGNFNEMLQCCASLEKIVSENIDGSSVEESNEIPDSGLGSSHSEGPSHIEDWPSLSILLPRSVVDACSFFKSNNFLLSGSSNSIERRSPPPTSNSHPPRSFASTGIHRLSRCGESREKYRRPATACQNCLGGSSTMNSEDDICRSAILFQNCAVGGNADSSRRTTQKLRLHAKELAMIGLPLYDQKRNLVERVVEGVAEVVRGGSCIVLLASLEKLLQDGLKMGTKGWDVIRGVTGPGPVTASVFQLITELEVIEKPENSRISHFLQGLVTLHSVDGWFSYIVLKENVLRQFYMESAFFIGAHTAYRSLFSRFIECLELLSVLNQCGFKKRMQHKRKQFSINSIERTLSAAKMPSDSRVPKSSSMPTKLAKNNNIIENITNNASDLISGNVPVPEIVGPFQSKNNTPSKIPVFRFRSKSNSLLKMSHSSSFRKTPTRICRLREAVDEGCKLGTVLPAEKGENVRVLSVRGLYSRCARFGIYGKGNLTIQNGILPTGKLDMNER